MCSNFHHVFATNLFISAKRWQAYQILFPFNTLFHMVDGASIKSVVHMHCAERSRFVWFCMYFYSACDIVFIETCTCNFHFLIFRVFDESVVQTWAFLKSAHAAATNILSFHTFHGHINSLYVPNINVFIVALAIDMNVHAILFRTVSRENKPDDLHTYLKGESTVLQKLKQSLWDWHKSTDGDKKWTAWD